MHEHALNAPEIANLLLIFLLVLFLFAYLFGLALHRRAGKKWSLFRTLCFISGIALSVLALSPPLATFGHHDLRGHMVQHLLIGMLAPLGLVLAAPLTLALRILPASRGRKITSIVASSPFHLISHPITALFLNIGGMYLLYLTPIYASLQHNMWLHFMMHLHFLAAGYLFTWSIAGPDPAPNRPSLRFRFIILFISMASHAYLSKFMYAYQYPRNSTHQLKEIEEAAMLMYYGGDLAEVLLAIAFFSVWHQARTRKRGIINPGSPPLPYL